MDDDAIESEGMPIWDRRLSRRDKVRRASVSVLAVVLSLVVLLSLSGAWQRILTTLPLGTVSAGTIPTRKMLTVAAHAPSQLAASSWYQIALPVPSDAIRSYATSPVDSATLYLCASPAATPNGVETDNALTLWRTSDSGRHWRTLPLPLVSAGGCYLHVASDAPRHLALLLTNAGGSGADCSQVVLYLSDDGGDHWQQTPQRPSAPRSAGGSYCDIVITARHLYFLHSYDVARGDEKRVQVSEIERSDDNGQTWVRADSGLPHDALFFPTLFRNGDTLVTGVLAGIDNKEATFWVTHNAGSHWQKVSMLPDSGVDTVLENALPAGSSVLPLYTEAGEDIPDLLFQTRVFQSADGRHWAALPPLPVPGASATHMGIIETLGVAPDGKLLVFGVDPQTGIANLSPFHPLSAQWLWAWDPLARRWSASSSSLPRPALQGCGSRCWNAQFTSDTSGSYLWAMSYDDDVGQTLYRVRLT